jgi:hypothetical protein
VSLDESKTFITAVKQEMQNGKITSKNTTVNQAKSKIHRRYLSNPISPKVPERMNLVSMKYKQDMINRMRVLEGGKKMKLQNIKRKINQISMVDSRPIAEYIHLQSLKEF